MTLKRILKVLYARGFVLDKINADLNFLFTEEDIDRAVRRWSVCKAIIDPFFDLPIALLLIRLLILRENVIVSGVLTAVLIILNVCFSSRIAKIFSAKLLLKIYNERDMMIKNAIGNPSFSNNKYKEN